MEIIKDALPLLGVIVGGLITFLVQNNSIRKNQRFEREKLQKDELNKKDEKKFQVFNEILHLNTKLRVQTHDMRYGPELDEKKYVEHIRPLLYEIYHLLSEEIINEVEKIEDVFDRQYALEEEAEDDAELLGQTYRKIIFLIKQEFKAHREAELNK
ncbi:hypothetical protein V7127_25330 [Bacillus sp. JJ1773]|uniref:hypothetical protein n=1 Tax=Bacillus sp. JJ1773 TaxID=3122965 RepID=UPI002FFFA188